MNINYDSPFNFKPIPTITPASDYWQNGTWKFNMPEITAGTGVSPSWVDVVLHGVTALTLVNAKANSLEYLSLFGNTEQLPSTYLDTVTLSGGCEQRNLPSGFTQVEYLEVETAGVYFLTGINATVNTDMGIAASNITSSSAQILVAQCESGGDYFRVAKAGASQRLIGNFGSSSVTDNNTDGVNKFTARLNKSGFYVNGSLVGTFSNIPSSFTDIGEVDIFRGKYSDSAYYASADTRFYGAFVNDNIFLPCRRNSDNQLGIYNTKTGQFILPSGTGSFTAGADVTTPTPDTPIDIVCNNGVIKVSKNLFNANVALGGTMDTSGRDGNPNPARARLEYLYLPTGTYTISNNGNTVNQILGASYSDNTGSNFSSIDDWAWHNLPFTFTLTSNRYVRFMVRNSSDVELTTNNISKFQVELGSTVTSYMPYGQIYTQGTVETVTDSNQLTANAERLLAVGDYKDTQEVISGSITRNVGITILDGSEEWALLSVSNKVFTLIFPFTKPWMANSSAISTHFNCRFGTPNAPYGVTELILHNTASRIYIDYPLYENDLAGFKQYLADQYANGTPVIVVYPLATATTETVTPQLLLKSPVTQTAGSISNLPIAITESSHTTPTPRQPLQINCNNGVLKLTPNLLDRSKETQGVYINKATGNIDTTASPWAVSDYIPVTAGSKITISNITFSSVSAGYNYYNSQKTLVSTISYETGTHTYTVPNNASYIRICYRYDPDDNVRINVGDSANDIYADGTTETVEITGKNLFNVAEQSPNKYYNATGDEAELYVDGVYFVHTGFIPCQPNATYTISGKRIATGNGTIYACTFFDKNKQFISRVTTGNPVFVGDYTRTYTTPTNAYYLSFNKKANDENCQIEQGSTATTYEPYFNGGTATAEMLLKVGDYQDVQSVIDGGVTRNVGVKVLDGTENWVYAAVSQLFFANNAVQALDETHTCYCSHYLGIPTNEIPISGSNKIKVGSNTTTEPYWNRIYIYANIVDYPTVEDFKQYLADQYAAGTPVIVVYPLATPITETVTGQPMNIQAGTNIVQITQASMDNLELEVKYKAGVSVTVEEIETAQLDDNVEVTING